MSRYFQPHLEILPPEQRRLWPQLRRAPELGLVLYGGTAIALRLGHRISVDFDFFTHQELRREDMKESFPFLAGATVLQDRPDTLTVLVADGDDAARAVKVSFFAGIDIGRVGEPQRTADDTKTNDDKVSFSGSLDGQSARRADAGIA